MRAIRRSLTYPWVIQVPHPGIVSISRPGANSVAIYRDIDIAVRRPAFFAVKTCRFRLLAARRPPCSALDMARIRTTRTARGARVRVLGRLTASDMGRLEHACADALLSRPARLEIDLRGVTHADRTAGAILQHLGHRGAIIIGGIHMQ